MVAVSLLVMAIVRGGAGRLWPEPTFLEALFRAVVTGLAGLLAFLGLGSRLGLERELVIPGVLRRLASRFGR